MKPHEPLQVQPRSHLFTVRLWQEEVCTDRYEVRLQVRHVVSGETRYFRHWHDAVTYLLMKLHEFEASSVVDSE